MVYSRSICYYAFDKIEPTKWELLSIKRKAIDIRRHWIEPTPCCSWNEYTYSTYNTEKSFYSTVAGSLSSKRFEVTRKYLRWFLLLFFCCPPVIHDPSYHMNVHAAGVESIRNDRQKVIGPITEQLCICCHSNIHGVMHLSCKQFAMYYMLLYV